MNYIEKLLNDEVMKQYSKPIIRIFRCVDSISKISEVVCINCKYRWIAVRPTNTLLKDIECPQCGQQGYVIETGEVIKEN